MTKATIQYRQLKTDGLWAGIDLKAMVVDVLRRQRRRGSPSKALGESAKQRIIDIDQDGSFVILNKITKQDSWSGPVFSGQLIHLQQGSDVHAVMQSLEDDTAEFVVQNLTIGAQARVLKGALYFAIVGNHVGLIEGQQVRGRMLERYLTRVLQDADELEAGQAIILNAKFAAGDGKELSESSEIEMSAMPGHSVASDGSDGEVSAAAPGARPPSPASAPPVLVGREARPSTETGGATVFDVLRLMGWSSEAVERLQAEVPDDGWIEGFFRVFIKEKSRRKKPISRATINEALRNIDVDDLGLRGDGSEKGGIVKLSVQRTVTASGTLLDPQDAMEQIVNALKDWAAKGKIDCTFAP